MHTICVRLRMCKEIPFLVTRCAAFYLHSTKSNPSGMRTAYVQRWTEDPHEDMETVSSENDFFIDDQSATAECGGLLDLLELLDIGAEHS